MREKKSILNIRDKQKEKGDGKDPNSWKGKGESVGKGNCSGEEEGPWRKI